MGTLSEKPSEDDTSPVKSHKFYDNLDSSVNLSFIDFQQKSTDGNYFQFNLFMFDLEKNEYELSCVVQVCDSGVTDNVCNDLLRALLVQVIMTMMMTIWS